MNKNSAQVALVTGSARRIGAAIAIRLHQAGFRVVIHCHQSLKAAHALAEDMNRQRTDSALVLSADLTIKQATTELIAKTIHWAHRLDLLVNNASIFQATHDSLNDAHWDTCTSRISDG